MSSVQQLSSKPPKLMQLQSPRRDAACMFPTYFCASHEKEVSLAHTQTLMRIRDNSLICRSASSGSRLAVRDFAPRHGRNPMRSLDVHERTPVPAKQISGSHMRGAPIFAVIEPAGFGSRPLHATPILGRRSTNAGTSFGIRRNGVQKVCGGAGNSFKLHAVADTTCAPDFKLCSGRHRLCERRNIFMRNYGTPQKHAACHYPALGTRNRPLVIIVIRNPSSHRRTRDESVS